MTMSKIALTAIACLAFAPAAFAEDFTSMPPNSANYGYTDGTQTLRLLGRNPYDAMAQVPSHGRALWIGRVAPNQVRRFTAQEKALFDRQSKELF